MTAHETLILPVHRPSMEDVRFWETACGNRGFCVRVFDDRDAAIAWLQT